MDSCVFCRIVNKKEPHYLLWEDNKHIAFLSIFPNTEGVTVVITKEHFDSYVFDLPDRALSELVLAAKKVSKILDSRLPDVGRTALVFEGFGVNHVHAKLFPMHGTKVNKWESVHSSVDTFFENYPGYISSHDGKRATDAYLSQVLKKLKSPE